MIMAGQKKVIKNLWRQFFSDPSKWWDHRSEKVSPRFPDFKHKKASASLWVDGKSNPPWVEAELAAMAPGTVQLNTFSWNRKLTRYAKAGQHGETMAIFHHMQRERIYPDEFTFVPVLNACASLGSLELGRSIHAQILASDCESDAYVSCSLIDMYCKCGSVEDAWRVFSKMSTRNVVAWTAMILGLVKCGRGQDGLDLFRRMQQEGVQPNPVTFVVMLNACSSVVALEEGRYVHNQILESGCESNVFVGSCLVDMYGKCGSMEDARKVFDRIPVRSVVAWSAMILGYAKCGHGHKALELSRQMQQEKIELNPFTYVGVLNACAIEGALSEGKRIHEQIIQRGFESNIFVGSCLVDMYAKCGSIEDAWRVFSKMPTRNVVTWSAIILGYVRCGQGEKALKLFQQMQQEGVHPNPFTFVVVLNACASLAALEEGRHFHKQVISNGWESDIFVGSSLVDMYAKCGNIEDAWRIFSKMPMRNVVAWSAMIHGYVKCGQAHKALELSRQMQQEGVEPDQVCFVAVVNACASLAELEEGRCTHEQILRRGFESDSFVGTSLIDMYAKCGSIEDSQRVFNEMPARGVVAWSTMILGHVRCGQGHKALELFQQMQREGVQPNLVTFVGLLNSCASMESLEEGRMIHRQIIQSGCEADVFVGSGLVDMYAKCGSISEAWGVFTRICVKNVVAWSTMILGFVKNGQGQKAYSLFQQMLREGVEPNSVTFVGALNACASVAALEEGRLVHEQITQRGCESDVFVANSLVDMYAKCGSISDALRIFNKISPRDLVSWNIMLAGYAMHGHANEALQHFQQMCEEGLKVDKVTFVSLLSACSHASLVDEGLQHFISMSSEHCITATIEHYTCIVDLLGRAGHLHEAEILIKAMLCEPNATVWMSLLGACRVHGNLEMGGKMAGRVQELDPRSGASHVQLSNIYAATGK